MSIHYNTISLFIIVINIAWYIVNCCWLENRVSCLPLPSDYSHLLNTKRNNKVANWYSSKGTIRINKQHRHKDKAKQQSKLLNKTNSHKTGSENMCSGMINRSYSIEDNRANVLFHKFALMSKTKTFKMSEITKPTSINLLFF